MRFIYQYKTKSNERREGELCAASRDAVYVELKKQGIRPFSVELAPGMLNHVAALGKRWLAIVVLAAMVIASLCVALRQRNTFESKIDASISAMTRRQMIGDAAIIEKGVRTAWADVFANEGEQFLASFAIPGTPAAKRNTTEEELRTAMMRHVQVDAADGIEVRQIKSMVEGVKNELRDFVANGGSVAQFCRLLVNRQEEEIGIYERAKSELINAEKSGMPELELEKLWESKNAQLRKLGIRLLPMPE